MEEQILGVTKLVNWLFAKPALLLLGWLHITPSNPDYPIPNHIAMELLVFLIAIVFFLWLKARLSVEKPGATQQCMEMILTNPMGLGVRDLLESNIGHGADRYISMLGSIGIFVLFCNLISLVPGLASPTADKSVPFGCAVVVFVYYNYSGIAKKGLLGHGKHFLGPNIYMSPLMLIVETFSNAARLLSLTVRLWVNMFVSELLYGIFLGLLIELFLFLGKLNTVGYVSFLLPLLIPGVFIILHIFVGIVQAFVFTILPVIYVADAVKENH
jgi:F-type H+-transporting ATPase subunit a